MQKLPEFKGKPLVEVPESIPTANFLEGDFGKAVFEEYKGRAEKDYNNARVLNVLSYEENIVKGSNLFAVVLLNKILRQEGLRTATQADLEKIIKTGVLNLKGFYEDSAIVLRSEDEPNSYLAKDIAKQIKQKQELKLPVMINLTDLEFVKDSNPACGFAFNLRNDANIIYAPELSHKNNQKRFSETNKNGLPVFSKDGTRTLYTGDSGLSGLFLGRGLGLGSSSDGLLAYSSSDGRVVIVSGGAASQNLSNYLAELQKEKAKQIQEIEQRYSKAEAILKGKK